MLGKALTSQLRTRGYEILLLRVLCHWRGGEEGSWRRKAWSRLCLVGCRAVWQVASAGRKRRALRKLGWGARHHLHLPGERGSGAGGGWELCARWGLGVLLLSLQITQNDINSAALDGFISIKLQPFSSSHFFCVLSTLGPVTACHHDHYQRRGGGMVGGWGSVCPSCFVSEAVQTTVSPSSHKTETSRFDMVRWECILGSWQWWSHAVCHQGSPYCLQAFRIVSPRTAGHLLEKTSLGRKERSQSRASHTVPQRLGGRSPAGPFSLTGDPDKCKVRSFRSPRLLHCSACH